MATSYAGEADRLTKFVGGIYGTARDPVEVRVLEMEEGKLGRAYIRSGRRYIDLDKSLVEGRAADLGKVLFHEIAHHRLGTAPEVGAGYYAEAGGAPLSRLQQMRLDAQERSASAMGERMHAEWRKKQHDWRDVYETVLQPMAEGKRAAARFFGRGI